MLKLTIAHGSQNSNKKQYKSLLFSVHSWHMRRPFQSYSVSVVPSKYLEQQQNSNLLEFSALKRP